MREKPVVFVGASRPILFSGPMVRAILSGAKTMTRRVVKLRDPSGTYSVHDDDGWPISADEDGQWHKDRCPYGMAGDRLWVRETFRETFDMANAEVMEYRAGGTRLIDGKSIKHGSHYPTSILPKWRPSIFMPRWASRITLAIESVRVERLNDITEADAVAEGCDGNCGIGYIPAYQAGPCVYHFAQVWESINGTGSWAANPWVWVVAFSRVQP